MNPSPHPKSRLSPDSTGPRRTSRRLPALAAASTIALATTLGAAGPAAAMLGPNETTDWIVKADPRNDHVVAAPQFNKKGKQVNKVAWDTSHADLEEVQYVWDPAVQQGQEDLHLLILDTPLPMEESSGSVGKRTDLNYSAQVFVDGARLLTFHGAHTSATSGRSGITWENPQAANYEQGCLGDKVAVPDQGQAWLILPARCLPSGAKSITKIIYTVELLAVTKKNVGKVAAKDTAEIVATIPVRQ